MIAIYLLQWNGGNTSSLEPGIYVWKNMPSSDAINVYGDIIGPLFLLTCHQEEILKCKEKVPSSWTSLFNGWLLTDNKDKVKNLEVLKNISKANQTTKRIVRLKDAVQGIDNLLVRHPNFELKEIPQGLESFGKAVDFMVDNSNSTVPFPKFDVATYF